MNLRAVAGVVVGFAAGAAVSACGYPDTGPIALDDQVEIAAGERRTIDVLANDRAPADQDMSITEVRAGVGEVSIDASATIEYTAPTAGLDDAFRYTVTADDGSTATATVRISIVGATSTTNTTTPPTTTPATTTIGTTPSTTTATTPTTVAELLPQVDPPEVDFGSVRSGESERRTVRLIAADEPWSPDWSSVGLVDGLSVVGDCGTLAPGAGCDVNLVWTPPTPRMLDVTLRPHPDVPLRLTGVAMLASPDWVRPPGAWWIGELRRAPVVEHTAVTGADDYVATAEICVDDACGITIPLERVGDGTRYRLTPVDPELLEQLRAELADAGTTAVLRLTALALAEVDGERFESPEGAIDIELTDAPFTATLVGYDPETAGPCEPVVVATVDLVSHLSSTVEVVALLVDDGGNRQFDIAASPIDVDPGAASLDLVARDVDITIGSIELNAAGIPPVLVDDVRAYPTGSCIE